MDNLKQRIEEIIQRNIILKANSDKDYTIYRHISAAKEISDFIQENFVPKENACFAPCKFQIKTIRPEPNF